MKLTPQSLSRLIKEELEVILTDDEAVEMFGEAAQLELPGLEAPPACEPADGVEDLSAQLAQMVVDSHVPPEHFNDLMELIYDKVAAGLEGIGVEDEEDSDEYRRTTMGFMESLRKATLNILKEQPTQDPDVAEKAAAGAEAQSAALSANPGDPRSSAKQSGEAASVPALTAASQSGKEIFTGGEESTTVSSMSARKEDDKLNEGIAFNRFAKLAGI